MSTIAILTIGTEVVRGEIVNTNASWISQRLSELGVSVAHHVSVRDDMKDLCEAIESLAKHHSHIIATGGLGPTTDDITRACVARVLGRPLIRDKTAEGWLATYLTERGRPLIPSQLRQAELPEGAVALRNHWGSAPGFQISIGPALVFSLPGVPREMKPMAEQYVFPAIEVKDHTAYRKMQVYGAPEVDVNDRLAGLEAEYDVTIGYRVRFPTIELKVLATSTDPRDAEHRVALAAEQCRARLGALIYALDEQTLVQVIAGQLRTRRLSLALAESCTGGLISSMLTAEPCSDFFQGGIVCYQNDIKRGLLDVDAELLNSQGAVSKAVVEQMALGAKRRLRADVAVAVSGIAGPTGGTEAKPVGLVHFAIATPSETVVTHQVFQGDRERIQLRGAYHALNALRVQLATEGNRS